MKVLTIAAALAWCFLSQAEAAERWPTKLVRIIVPYAAGSTPDIVARMIFDRVQKQTEQTIIIDNRPGAGGMIGTDAVAKSEPDGHTLVFGPGGPLSTNKLLYKKMSYDPERDLAPVALVADASPILVASTAIEANDVRSLLQEMADPARKVAYASPGAGTIAHLSIAYLVGLSGASVPHVAYKQSNQIIPALIANDVQLASLPVSAVDQFIRNGKLKAIAVAGNQRNAAMPNLPSFKEQGFNFEPSGWYGVSARAGTSLEIREAIHRAISLVLKDPEVVSSYRTWGFEAGNLGPSDFGKYMAREYQAWKVIIERNRISLE